MKTHAGMRNAACFLSFQDESGTVIKNGDEWVHISDGMLFHGGVRLIDEPDGAQQWIESSGDESATSQGSTTLPDDLQAEEVDVSSLMSGGPIMMQIDHIVPDGWQHEIDIPEHGPLEEEQTTSIIFAPHHLGHVQDHIEHILADLPASQPPRAVDACHLWIRTGRLG